MSQNSLTLPTSGTLSGLGAVQAVNAALDTLNTLASGASAPSSPEAGQFWHDIGNNLLKIRSQDNTTWIIVGSLDETNHIFSAQTKAAPPIYGLTISNDTTTPATFIDVAAGGAFDSTAAFYMRLAAAMRKNVSTSWAAGSGNGALDTGAINSSGGTHGNFYHVHLIYDQTSGAVDVLTSLSYSNPVMPSGFTYFVPIGATLWTTGSAVWSFTQYKNRFISKTMFSDLQTSSPATSPTMLSLTVPTGPKVVAYFRAGIASGDSAYGPEVLFQSPDETAVTPAAGSPFNSSLSCAASGGNTEYDSGQFELVTDTSGRINYVVQLGGGGGVTLGVNTYAFEYPRGLQ